MTKKNPSIILFGIAGLLYLVAALLNNEYLALLTKPVIIPTLFVYYFFETKGKVNNFFVFSLF